MSEQNEVNIKKTKNKKSASKQEKEEKAEEKNRKINEERELEWDRHFCYLNDKRRQKLMELPDVPKTKKIKRKKKRSTSVKVEDKQETIFKSKKYRVFSAKTVRDSKASSSGESDDDDVYNSNKNEKKKSEPESDSEQEKGSINSRAKKESSSEEKKETKERNLINREDVELFKDIKFKPLPRSKSIHDTDRFVLNKSNDHVQRITLSGLEESATYRNLVRSLKSNL